MADKREREREREREEREREKDRERERRERPFLSTRIGGHTEVRADDFNSLGELLLGVLGRDGRDHNAVITTLPVSGSGNGVVISELERVNDTDQLVEVTAGAR